MTAAVNRFGHRAVRAPNNHAEIIPLMRPQVGPEVVRGAIVGPALPHPRLQFGGGPHRDVAPAAGAGLLVAPKVRQPAQQPTQPAQQPAQPVQQPGYGWLNAPVPPPHWPPRVHNEMLAGIHPRYPPPQDLREAMAHTTPGAAGQRTTPSVDQHQFGIANQAPHRIGSSSQEAGQVDLGMFPHAFLYEIDHSWYELPPPAPPANEGMPAFAPLPQAPSLQAQAQAQAQDWNHVGNVNYVPPAPPATEGDQQGLFGQAGMIAEPPEIPHFQDIWQWNDQNLFDWDLLGPIFAEAHQERHVPQKPSH